MKVKAPKFNQVEEKKSSLFKALLFIYGAIHPSRLPTFILPSDHWLLTTHRQRGNFFSGDRSTYQSRAQGADSGLSAVISAELI